VKIDAIQSFCIERHVGVHLDMSIAFVNMDARKKLLTFKQPSLQMATKNEFQLPILWWSKNFSH